MNDEVELRDLGGRFRRRWWVIALFAVAGFGIGMLVADRVAPTYRAQGTLLVGPVSGTVTRSTTLRASESLASFYADLARRQVVLGPVAETLQTSTPWEELRNQVSAVTPDQNPRLVTVTVADRDEERAQRIAAEIVQQLLALSPGPSGGSTPGFVNRQVASVQRDIELAEAEITQLDAAIAQAPDTSTREALVAQRSQRQKLVDEWRQTYVGLMTVDPTSDAGGITVIDEVRSLTASDGAGVVRQGALLGVVGLMLGLLCVWVWSSRGGRRPPTSPLEENSWEDTDGVAPTAGRERAALPAVARSPVHEG